MKEHSWRNNVFPGRIYVTEGHITAYQDLGNALGELNSMSLFQCIELGGEYDAQARIKVILDHVYKWNSICFGGKLRSTALRIFKSTYFLSISKATSSLLSLPFPSLSLSYSWVHHLSDHFCFPKGKLNPQI